MSGTTKRPPPPPEVSLTLEVLWHLNETLWLSVHHDDLPELARGFCWRADIQLPPHMMPAGLTFQDAECGEWRRGFFSSSRRFIALCMTGLSCRADSGLKGQTVFLFFALCLFCYRQSVWSDFELFKRYLVITPPPPKKMFYIVIYFIFQIIWIIWQNINLIHCDAKCTQKELNKHQCCFMV